MSGIAHLGGAETVKSKRKKMYVKFAIDKKESLPRFDLEQLT